jgi:HEAT repeat protein
MARFQKEFEEERQQQPVAAVVAIVRAFAAAEIIEQDLPDLRAYLPRLLRLSVQAGAWREAHELIGMIKDSPAGWAPISFVQELQQPSSISAVRARLLEQTEDDARAFTEFAMDFGEFALDVLGQVMAEMDGAPQVRPLTEAIVERCRNTPERLAPWIADRRPNVVRSVVQMLGSIGGNAIVGPLQSAIMHPDVRVRAEVVQALRTADVKIVKPLLLAALPTLDARLFIQALQKLAEARDTQVGQALLMMMIAPEFEQRSLEEKHAIYSTLGATGGDDVIPELEAELLKGGWFERVNESHRLTVARCLARIGTPMARMVLENGAKSKRQQVRDVCADVLSRWEGPRGT